MAPQYSAQIAGVQQSLLDSAKGQFALVRVAVEKSNQAFFEATQEYLDIAQSDLALVSNEASPSVGDLIARGYDRAAQLLELQEKVLRSLSDAWTPVAEKAGSDATSWVESARKPASTSTPRSKAA